MSLSPDYSDNVNVEVELQNSNLGHFEALTELAWGFLESIEVCGMSSVHRVLNSVIWIIHWTWQRHHAMIAV